MMSPQHHRPKSLFQFLTFWNVVSSLLLQRASSFAVVPHPRTSSAATAQRLFFDSPTTTTTSCCSPKNDNPAVQTTRLSSSSSSESTANDDSEAPTAAEAKEEEIKLELVSPFPAAADPLYKCRGPIGQGDFIISRTGEPTAEELSNENMLQIVVRGSKVSDLEVNTLVWKCLGYRFDASTETWTNEKCFPKWREAYPDPPDVIGMQRIYEKEVDQPSLRSNQALVKSVPMPHKQSLKTHLKPLGFSGYKYAELTPNKTRRAQCTNWLIYYREQLFGYSVEELRERRQKEREEEEQKRKEEGENWQSPVKEVF